MRDVNLAVKLQHLVHDSRSESIKVASYTFCDMDSLPLFPDFCDMDILQSNHLHPNIRQCLEICIYALLFKT